MYGTVIDLGHSLIWIKAKEMGCKTGVRSELLYDKMSIDILSAISAEDFAPHVTAKYEV